MVLLRLSIRRLLRTVGFLPIREPQAFTDFRNKPLGLAEKKRWLARFAKNVTYRKRTSATGKPKQIASIIVIYASFGLA